MAKYLGSIALPCRPHEHGLGRHTRFGDDQVKPSFEQVPAGGELHFHLLKGGNAKQIVGTSPNESWQSRRKEQFPSSDRFHEVLLLTSALARPAKGREGGAESRHCHACTCAQGAKIIGPQENLKNKWVGSLVS